MKLNETATGRTCYALKNARTVLPDVPGEGGGDVGGEREEELAPIPQWQSKKSDTREETAQPPQEAGTESPTPRLQAKRPSHSLSESMIATENVNTSSPENVGGERERELAPIPQWQSKKSDTGEETAQPPQEADRVTPTPRLQAKRPSHSLSESMIATENGEEPFKIEVNKKKNNEQ
ncbi:UNVERIFIED_CONTAM: hypothetical protein FKN15_027239 [Acipenser sinensis]